MSIAIDALIDWYWEQHSSFLPDGLEEDGICQCGTEKLIEHSDNQNKMRTFLMVSSFIDQMIYTHFQDIYPRFRARYHFPKLLSHPTIVGMASPGWLVYSYYGYDKKMDWEAARPMALQLFTESLKYLASIDHHHNPTQKFLDIADKEALLEFGPEAGGRVLAILSSVDIAGV